MVAFFGQGSPLNNFFAQEPAFDSIIRGGPKTGNVPAAPPPANNGGLPPNISAMLTQLQDPTLQSILGAQNVNTPPPTLKPEEAELYQVFPTARQLSVSLNVPSNEQHM